MSDERIIGSSDGTWFEDGIDRGRVLIAGEATGNAYSLMELSVATRSVDADFGAHLHRDFDEVFVIRQGTIEFVLDDQTTTLVAGDVVRVPASNNSSSRTEPINRS